MAVGVRSDSHTVSEVREQTEAKAGAQLPSSFLGSLRQGDGAAAHIQVGLLPSFTYLASPCGHGPEVCLLGHSRSCHLTELSITVLN